MTPKIAAEVIDQVNALPEDQQQKVLDFIRSLATAKPPTIQGRDLLRLAGTISPEDGAEMMQAIEEGCERVYPDEW